MSSRVSSIAFWQRDAEAAARDAEADAARFAASAQVKAGREARQALQDMRNPKPAAPALTLRPARPQSGIGNRGIGNPFFVVDPHLHPHRAK